MILIDTNVISEPWKLAPDPRVVAWIDAQAVETLYLSAITVAELRFGIAALPTGKRRETLYERLERDVLPLFMGRVLPFDLDASQAYAELAANAKAVGKAIGKADGYIAATAAARGFMIATRDTSPFEAAGLSIVNPWGGPATTEI
ncbi:MAG: type II toxin-antitoxin system VapC family toxin [Mesorhizobium sp.]|uniref:type II toxin-antitoxin system VapC family toxin n=1 Tax=Mesorhizobium sp. TaxID=1871066 RepID=UPI0011F6E942|nr:type II toxin-antitoxin system VapC family toxin [Mesorhizobium sp.]TIP73034.1 MAG: type II toxin-antitoxin system VapC family toxin [Mesorhizobium sp.]TIQ09068.1 MAG: type II toxin-antitoxin system VapC family toxin [Mesorhizobium sp.]TIR48562.1 MAG: type II toxin-antitoxin system VapC family toxin [Mesorhizobium sp.]TJV96858.1 MAG: type II toxin-antitoxin system VapC family toxin [Mesorhizobium sp.]